MKIRPICNVWPGQPLFLAKKQMLFNQQKESRLVNQAVNGDTEAFGDLYEIHLEAIYQYIYYRLSNRQDAEDLTEAVFLKAWQAIGDFEHGNVPFRAWLYRIAHNTVVDHYRARKETQSIDMMTQLTDEQTHVEQQVSTREWSDQLAKVIRKLSPLHQHVLVLRFINGLSHAEVAEILGRRVESIRVLQHRALKELQGLLALEEAI